MAKPWTRTAGRVTLAAAETPAGDGVCADAGPRPARGIAMARSARLL